VSVIVMMCVVRIALVGDCAVGMFHASVRQMRVIMMVFVDSKRRRRARAEQALYSGLEATAVGVPEQHT
jgi:hypothetical protein